MEILVEEDVFLSDSKIVESSVLKQVAQEEGQYGFKELRKDGTKLTEEDKQKFFETVETIKQTLLAVGLPYDEANGKAFSLAVEQLGRINSVPFKLLNFTPAHIEWFKQQ